MNWAIPLLADTSPCLRFLVLRELMEHRDDDPEVIELDGLRASDPLVVALLQAQNEDGSWRGADLPGSATGDLVSATALALARLGYLGFGTEHPPVQRGADFLFSRQRADGSWPLFQSHEVGEGGIDGGYDRISLQTSMPLRGLAACGYAVDPRAERAYEWLLAQRLPDGAWPTGIAHDVYGFVGGYRRLPHSQWGCRTNTTMALVCLAHHPDRCRSAEAQRALDLLLGRETRERENIGLEVARMIGVEPATGRFTYFARFDLALLLDLCRRVGAGRSDPRVAALADFIASCRGAGGLWEYVPHPEASRWVTFDLLRSLSRLGMGDEWEFIEPSTPFTPYRRGRHRY